MKRIPFPLGVIGLAALLTISSAAAAQTSQSQKTNEARSPWKYYPTDRAAGDGGPAPKRELTGTWAGPRSGAGVPDGGGETDKPSLTPLGQQLMSQNKPLGKLAPRAPTTRP